MRGVIKMQTMQTKRPQQAPLVASKKLRAAQAEKESRKLVRRAAFTLRAFWIQFSDGGVTEYSVCLQRV